MSSARLPLHRRLVFGAAQLGGGLLRRTGLGAGQVLPGRLALRLDQAALQHLTQDRETVLVTGTNGKTTTTRLLTVVLRVAGEVVSNATGANLEAGLVSALLGAAPGDRAVLEVDEVVLPLAVRACRPRAVVLLNLSRDQLDRTSEVSLHADRWAAALRGSDATVVANADDPLVVSAVRAARPDERDVVWVGARQRWLSDVSLCPSCRAPGQPSGDPWACAGCGLRRPVPQWSLRGDVLTGAGVTVAVDLSLPGRVNLGNAAFAIATAHLLGVRPGVAAAAAAGVLDVAGRYARYRVGPQEVRLLLAKNPAGWLEARDELRGPVVLLFNARPEDGTDPSWLYDVPFEQLAGHRVVVAGERATDLAVRLHYAEVPHEVAPDLLTALDLLPAGAVDVLANYSAFVGARAVLDSRTASSAA